MSDPATSPAPAGEPAILVADHAALDLLNTVAVPRGRPLDWISDGQALLAWLGQRGLLSEVELGRVRRRFSVADLDAAAAACRELREWLRQRLNRPELARADAETGPLRFLLAEDWSRPALSGNSLTREREFRSPPSVLGSVAEAVGALLLEADRDRTRRCEGEGCTLWFLDTSKTNRRRWCSMALCGNRAKVAAHRARTRAG